MNVVEIRRLSKAYGPVRVLEEFSLEAPKAGRVAVLGPSGCGKTTLLRLIAGLDLPDGGEILLHGRSASRPDWALAPHLRNLGVVFQSPALWPHMSAAENIRFGLSQLDRAAADDRAAGLMRSLGLDGLGERYPHELSGGEARRVALARALAPRPELLLLDEPLTNLNAVLKQQVHDVLQAHLDEHRPVLIYVTHDPSEVSTGFEQVVTLAGRDTV